MRDWNVEDGLKWRSLDTFGAEVEHDLSAPLADATARRFVELIWQTGLIVARQQSLSMQQQTRLLALLGPTLERAGETGYMSNENPSPAASAELTFHADAAYTNAPFDALSLHALDVVDGASSTRFVSAERAYAALPTALRERLAAHDAELISPSFETLAQRSCDVREHKPMRSRYLPAIRTNPHSGRACVWVSEMHAARLMDMPWEQSRALLHEVFEHLYAPENLYEHRWHNGDLVIWDNIALQHARGSLKSTGRRVLQRVIVGTEGVSPHLPEQRARPES